MDNPDFQPLYEEKDKESFSIWDIKSPEPEITESIDSEEELAKECEFIREEAKKAGYQEGLQQAASHVQKKQQELAHWLDLLQHPAKLLDNELNQEIVQTILWICEVCIGVELSIHPEKLLTLIDVIKPELPLLQGKKQLLLNPEDADYLMNELKPSGDSELIQFIIPDPSLARGDFYLKSDFSDLDGRVKTRLKNLLKSYLQNDNHDDMDSE
ncbi:FliH/SctL family protein [Legionella micdadei]|uniref:Flagellar assembly protein FliH n=1 Tax=Legionella micdadei TaxID=451 RepID=A0A098GG41_LEGMI|nr:FliH/SctL family protein [Legionella micdadei]ARG97934.1 hypothetical protein B6N58_09830 [Legionella micdadei]ARG99746.1 hypothetical protein B6V88_04580 [Legionella micdadei]KTD28656.1 polar flagellar assembly protein FliH [Legionella micdadei]NSL19311.1 flagellar assembly protein FliH [Legionella micdadei]CEG60451.1 Flagellar assembly protein FliH [Legionella micdadei]